MKILTLAVTALVILIFIIGYRDKFFKSETPDSFKVLKSQGNSDDVLDIERDLESVDFNNLDLELKIIDNKLQ